MSNDNGLEAGTEVTGEAQGKTLEETLKELQDQNVKLQEDIKKAEEDKEHIRASQQGSDSMVAKLQSQIKDLESDLEARMNKEELKQLELKKREDELNELRDKVKNIEETSKIDKINAFKIKKLNEYRLDADLSDVIEATTEDQALLKIEKIKELLEKEQERKLKEIMNQATPTKGDQDKPPQKVRGATVLDTLQNLS